MKNDRMDSVRNADSSIGSAATFGANVARMLFVALAAVMCVGMWGCSDVDFRWSENRSGASVVGFVDDSLVMVGDYRCWSEITDKWNGEYIDIDGCGRERLCVYNYRVQEEGPRWCDSLSSEEMTGIFGGQMTDSVIWGGEVSKAVRLWKIGENPHEIKLNETTEHCSVKFRISSLKLWLDGTFFGRSGESLAAGGDSCQYAVLDTVARTLTYKRLDDGLKWIQKCDDVRAWGDDVYCLRYESLSSIIYLKKENEMVDRILVENQGWYSGSFFMGNLMLVDGNVCEYKNGWVCYPRQGILKIGFHAENGIILQF